jgi:hypothetical protein
MDYIRCVKEWFTKLVMYDEKIKENETYIDPDTELHVGIPTNIESSIVYGNPPDSPLSTSSVETPPSNERGYPDKAPDSEPRAKLTEKESDDIINARTGALQSDEESSEEKELAKGVGISKTSTKSYSQIYSESIAKLSEVLEEEMDTAALSAALNGEDINIETLLRTGQSTKACKIIGQIMYDEQFGSARYIGSRGKGNKQQMSEIWGNDITDWAKSDKSQCYLCTGKIVPGAQPEMEHRMNCGEFYGIFSYIYSLYPKELAEWRFYVNNIADKAFKKALLDYYKAINMGTIDEVKLNEKYSNIINKFFTNSGIILDDTSTQRYHEFANLLRAYLHEFAYAHHVCNQIKYNHDLDTLPIVKKYHNVVIQYLNGMQPSNYNLAWRHMKIKSEYSKEEKPKIMAELTPTNLPIINRRIVDQMNLLRQFSQEIARESGLTQNRMILQILRDALINIKGKKGEPDPSTRINEQALLLARGGNFHNNDIRDAFEFNRDFNPPPKTPSDTDWKDKIFINRLPRFLDRIDTILENTHTLPNVPNTLNIIYKYLRSRFVNDPIRAQILSKLKDYILILTKINDKVGIILKYADLPDRDDWFKVSGDLYLYLNRLKELEKVERKPAGALIAIDREVLDTTTGQASSQGARSNQQNFLTQRRGLGLGLGRGVVEQGRGRGRGRVAFYPPVNRLLANATKKDSPKGGRRQQIRKTHKLKRRRNQTMKRKYRSRKNTRRH